MWTLSYRRLYPFLVSIFIYDLHFKRITVLPSSARHHIACFWCNTKGGFSQNVKAALFLKVDDDQWLKGIVHFEINFWYVLAYLKGSQDVGVFVSTAFSILPFFSQTVVVYQSYTGGEGGPSKNMHREVKIKHDLMTRKYKYTLMA